MTWFKNTTLVDDGGASGSVVIAVPNVFIKQQLERKYRELIIEVLQKNGVQGAESVEFKIQSISRVNTVDEPRMEMPAQESFRSESTASSNAIPTTAAFTASLSQATTSGSAQGSQSFSHSYRQGINERYTLDNFVVGSGNELAFAACQSIANSPGTKYNPLFLYGGVGIGKTHLMQAVGNAVLARNPKAKVLYITTEQFVQEFVDSIRFKKRRRNVLFCPFRR